MNLKPIVRYYMLQDFCNHVVEFKEPRYISIANFRRA